MTPALGSALCLAAAAFTIALASCAHPAPSPVPAAAPAIDFSPAERAIIASMSPLPPLPKDPTNAVADNPAAARLGQYLFFDTRLSASGKVSCASCHIPEKSFTDAQPVPINFSATLRNVPALWNVAYNRWYFWDGRADSLWCQALDPLESTVEHGGNRRQYTALLNADPALRAAYQRVFGPPPSPDDAPAVNRCYANIGKAIAAYERRLISRSAPFDAFAQDLAAKRPTSYPLPAQRGLKLFIGPANCRSCHHGPNFTDGEFHNTGIPDPSNDPGRLNGITRLLTNPYSAMGAFNDDPDGRRSHPTAFLVNSTDFAGQFKTPSLRNVATTAPYMHRGQFATLHDVIHFYNTLPIPPQPPAKVAPFGSDTQVAGHRHSRAGIEQVLKPLNLSDGDIDDLVAFLESLTDCSIDPALTRPPASP